jgi:hypothetical protein
MFKMEANEATSARAASNESNLIFGAFLRAPEMMPGGSDLWPKPSASYPPAAEANGYGPQTAPGARGPGDDRWRTEHNPYGGDSPSTCIPTGFDFPFPCPEMGAEARARSHPPSKAQLLKAYACDINLSYSAFLRGFLTWFRTPRRAFAQSRFRNRDPAFKRMAAAPNG